MVAMVAMPREPTQTRDQRTRTPAQALRGRVRDSPSAWRHSNGNELPHLQAFWRVATMATMATPGPDLFKIISSNVRWLVITPPTLSFFSQVSTRGGPMATMAMVAMVAMLQRIPVGRSKTVMGLQLRLS